MSKQTLTADRLREVLTFEPDSGIFRWRVWKGARAPIGAIAGSPDTYGYTQIIVDGHPYRAHRMAWLYVHGSWPAGQIDHINGVVTDNRLSNLRDVTNRVNAENKRRGWSKGGLLGVTYRGDGRWEARITVKGVAELLGRYPTKEAAHDAYVSAKRIHHEGCTI